MAEAQRPEEREAMKRSDPILVDIIQAFDDGHMDLPPSELSQMSVADILEAMKHMNCGRLKLWLKEMGNIRGPRIPVRRDATGAIRKHSE